MRRVYAIEHLDILYRTTDGDNSIESLNGRAGSD